MFHHYRSDKILNLFYNVFLFFNLRSSIFWKIQFSYLFNFFICKQSAKDIKRMHRVNKTCRYVATETKTEK